MEYANSTNLNEIMIIKKNRLAINSQFLHGLYKINKNIIDNAISSNDWEFTDRGIDGKFYKFIYVDSISSHLISQYKIPTIESLDDDIKRKIDLDSQKQSTVTKIKLHLETKLKNKLIDESKDDIGTILKAYIAEGLDVVTAGLFVRHHLLLEECATLSNHYSIENIYLAVDQLRTEEKFDLIMMLKIKSRQFYTLLNDCIEFGVIAALRCGLKGKPSNNGTTTCDATKGLIVAMRMHFNNKSDTAIMHLTNTIILAKPGTYNNGRRISRPTVNRIKNERRILVGSGIGGDDYLMDVVLPHAKLLKPSYPLDKAEVDFSKVHMAIKNELSKKVKRVVCKIKDRCSGRIIGRGVYKSECYELFRQTLRDMFKTTGGVLAFEMVGDFSAVFRSKEFERVRKFIIALTGVFRQTKSPRGKAGIESHFSTLVKTYMPEYIGSLGGNIATSKKNSPRKEILILLNDPKYMRTIQDCDKILYDIDKKYNLTPYTTSSRSPNEIYASLEKPHGIRCSPEIVAYLSFKRTSCKFKNSVFTLYYGNNTYTFGHSPEFHVNNQEGLDFIMDRTDDVFDLFYDTEKLSEIYVFEQKTAKFLMKLPLTEFLYGCKIDHILEPGRRVALLKFLRDRLELKKLIKKQISELLSEIKDQTGMEAHELLEHFTGSAKGLEPDDILYEILDHLSNNEPIKIDPFEVTTPVFKRKGSPNSEALATYKPIAV